MASPFFPQSPEDKIIKQTVKQPLKNTIKYNFTKYTGKSQCLIVKHTWKAINTAKFVIIIIIFLAVLCGIIGHLFFHILAVYRQAFTLTAMTMSD